MDAARLGVQIDFIPCSSKGKMDFLGGVLVACMVGLIKIIITRMINLKCLL